ncbi:MAG TPA: trypsin-like peptidase domain-containing protein, partial [Pirellulales bacterium]|nr:trypsin-like peptidase domain-containing protein [Pirellulales bacterium]
MKKLFLPCLLAAIAGLAISQFLMHRQPAQEESKSASPQRDASSTPASGRVIDLTSETRGPVGGEVIPVNQAGLDHLTLEERVNVKVYESGNRSVVNINTRSVRADPILMFETPSEGAGSGSVLDKQGHILTNFHVIEGSQEIQVTLFDGITYNARPVGVDPNT